MPATAVARTESGPTIQAEIPDASSLPGAEEAGQQRLNEAGTRATGEALQRSDAGGAPITAGGTELTSKGEPLKGYQAPYGVAPARRHAYRSGRGGTTSCPLGRNARIVVSPTPRCARTASHKYAEAGSARVIQDPAESPGRTVARCCVRGVADAGAAVAVAEEEGWDYAPPGLGGPAATITIGMDGTCLLRCRGGGREAMAGTVGLDDGEGQRPQATDLAATPEYGKATFRSWAGWGGRSGG